MIGFSTDHFEENRYREEDLIRLFPFGISLNMDPSRPILLLKDDKGEQTLPVTLNPLEAGITLGQTNQNLPLTSPHTVFRLYLESMNMKLDKCVFVEIKGVHQLVRISFEGHPTHGSLKVRAEEAMSLCLHLNVPIYATKKLMQKSRLMSAQVQDQNVATKAASDQLGQVMHPRNGEYLN